MKLKIIYKIFIILQFFQIFVAAQTLELDFYLDKDIFLVGEPIVGIVLLKNNGNDINIPKFGFLFNLSGLKSELFDNNNQSIKRNHDITIDYDLTRYYQIKNGESICDFLDISYKYGTPDNILSFNGLSSKRRFLPIGNYKLIVSYFNPEIMGDTISKKINFKVIAPTKQNDVETYNDLKLISNEFEQSKDYYLYYKNLRNIISKKSKSNYKIIAYTKLIFELNLNKKNNDALQILERMLKDYPNKVTTYWVSTVFWNSEKDFFLRQDIQEKLKLSTIYNYLQYYLKLYDLITKQ